LIESHDAFDQSGFARAIFTQQRVKLACLHADRNVIKGHQLAEGFAHAHSFK
jgi:hypothetical protein